MNIGVKGLLLVLCVALLASCHRHRPAPIEDYSASQVKYQQNADGTYSVRRGDTLSIIAFSHGLDHRDIAAWNGISSPYVIHPGQTLRLSPPASLNSRASGKSSGVQTAGIKTPGASTTRSQTSSTPPPPQTDTTSAPASQNQADPQSWRWPANGRVLRGYVATNPSRNGLDIVGTEGQPIMASAGGEIVYSGNGLLGYGELIECSAHMPITRCVW
jgi:lipoprotein NlpD